MPVEAYKLGPSQEQDTGKWKQAYKRVSSFQRSQQYNAPTPFVRWGLIDNSRNQNARIEEFPASSIDWAEHTLFVLTIRGSWPPNPHAGSLASRRPQILVFDFLDWASRCLRRAGGAKSSWYGAYQSMNAERFRTYSTSSRKSPSSYFSNSSISLLHTS